MKTLLTLFLIASSAFLVSARAQNNPNSTAMPSTPVSDSSACPQAIDMDQRHLQGVWHADLPHHGGATVLRLGQHPELAGSVRGTLERASRTAQVTGDVHAGELSLEESMDGKRISATWTGDVAEGRCGKEIRGFWSASADDGEAAEVRVPFVMRKQAVWQ